MAGWGWPLAKWTNTATTAPGAGDDIDDDWQVTSIWIDVTNDKGYVCLDNTRGAAVWYQFSGSGAGFANPMTTLGDMIYGGSAGVAARLAIGTASYVLMVNPITGIPYWSSEVVDARSSTSLGLFATLDDRLEAIEVFAGVSTAYYSYDFSNRLNSQYAALGVW